VGREAWIAAVLHALTETPPKKLVVLQGPMGVGKSSELHRLAWHFLRTQQPGYQVLWLPLLMS
jgi:flagellar biosynthesis GTPase FlhF